MHATAAEPPLLDPAPVAAAFLYSDVIKVCIGPEQWIKPVRTLEPKKIFSADSRIAASNHGAHVGLTPRVYQSGEIDRSGQIRKAGDHSSVICSTRQPRH